MRFQGKVALITAAASGIGRATAGIIGREGGRIAAVDTNRERLDATIAEIRAAGGEAHPYNADALDAGAVDNVVADAAKRFGRIDILVNAVGGSTIIAKPGATTEELTLADWQALIHFNLTGTFLFTHAVIPVMKRQKSGKIVNLASIAGRGKSVASSSAYATAKGGIIALTTKLAQRARALRHQRQRHRAGHHADRAHPPALGAAPARGARRRHRAHAAAAHGRSGGPGQRHLLPGLRARRFRHRPHHRRDGRALSSARMQSGAGRQRGERS